MKAVIELLPEGVNRLILLLHSALRVSSQNLFICFCSDTPGRSTQPPQPQSQPIKVPEAIYDKVRIEILSFTDLLEHGPIGFSQITSEFFNPVTNRDFLRHHNNDSSCITKPQTLFERFEIVGIENSPISRGNNVIFHITSPQIFLQHLKTIYAETDDDGSGGPPIRTYQYCTLAMAHIPLDALPQDGNNVSTSEQSRLIGLRVTGSEKSTRMTTRDLAKGLTPTTYLQQYHAITLIQHSVQNSLGMIDTDNMVYKFSLCRNLALRTDCVKLFAIKLSQGDNYGTNPSYNNHHSNLNPNNFPNNTSSENKKAAVLSLLRRFVDISPNFSSIFTNPLQQADGINGSGGIGVNHFLSCTIDLRPFFISPSFISRHTRIQASVSHRDAPLILADSKLSFIIQTDLIESEVSFTTQISARTEFLEQIISSSQITPVTATKTMANDNDDESVDLEVKTVLQTQTKAQYYIQPRFIPLLCSLQNEPGDFRFEIYENMFSGFCRGENKGYVVVSSLVAPLSHVYE